MMVFDGRMTLKFVADKAVGRNGRKCDCWLFEVLFDMLLVSDLVREQ